MNTFIEIISLTYKRFSSNRELRARINQSKDVPLLSKLSHDAIEIVTKFIYIDDLEYIPEKGLNEIPINWFKAAVTVIRKDNYYLNKNTVINSASNAYRQHILTLNTIAVR